VWWAWLSDPPPNKLLNSENWSMELVVLSSWLLLLDGAGPELSLDCLLTGFCVYGLTFFFFLVNGHILFGS
jgi:hypothetical protein